MTFSIALATTLPSFGPPLAVMGRGSLDAVHAEQRRRPGFRRRGQEQLWTPHTAGSHTPNALMIHVPTYTRLHSTLRTAASHLAVTPPFALRARLGEGFAWGCEGASIGAAKEVAEQQVLRLDAFVDEHLGQCRVSHALGPGHQHHRLAHVGTWPSTRVVSGGCSLLEGSSRRWSEGA